MATYSFLGDGLRQRRGPGRERYELSNEINFAEQALAVATQDSAKVLDIPEGTTVIAVWAKVNTACPSGATCKLGIATDKGRFAVRVPLDATGGPDLKARVGSTDMFDDKAPRNFSPYYFSSAGQIYLTATADGNNTNLSSGVVEVIALCSSRASSAKRR
jgi:hypothetical protein